MAAYAVTDSLSRPVEQPAARSMTYPSRPTQPPDPVHSLSLARLRQVGYHAVPAARSLDGRRDERSWAAVVGVAAVLLDAAFQVTAPKNSLRGKPEEVGPTAFGSVPGEGPGFAHYSTGGASASRRPDGCKLASGAPPHPRAVVSWGRAPPSGASLRYGKRDIHGEVIG